MRILITLLLLLVWQTSLLAEDNPSPSATETARSNSSEQVAVQPWPTDFFTHLSYDIGHELDETSVKLSYAIFDSIVEQTLFSQKLGNMNLSLKIDRDIFYNSDIYKSYTVVDYFKVPMSIPLNRSLSLPSSALGLGLNMSVSLNFTLLNIRQVKPQEFGTLESVIDLRKQITALEENIILDKGGETAEGVKSSFTDNKDLVDFILIDKENPLKQAMYHNLWNLVTNPFHMPVTKKNFLKMDVNEIYSYGLNGVVQFGGSAGWNQVIVQGLDSNVGIGISTYLSGQFKVSIMKEADKTALVKVSKVRGKGTTGFLGVRDSKYTLFEGFTILNHSGVGKLRVKVIPFLFTADKQLNRAVEVAYRYDFNKPQAWKAYKQALKGMLQLSDELALKKGSGVTHAFDRTKYTTQLTSRYKMSLFLIFEKGHSTRSSFSHAVVKLPNETYKTFQAVSENVRFHDFFLIQKEQQSYRFDLMLDDHYSFASSAGKNLRVSMKNFDTRTYGDELAKYAAEIEFVTGQANIFPRVPIYAPIPSDVQLCDENQRDLGSDTCYNLEKIDYGEGQFSYMMDFSGQQILNFLALSRHDLWKYLEKGFGVKEGQWSSKISRSLYQFLRTPLAIMNLPLLTADLHIKEGNKFYAAWKFYRNWKKVKRAETSLAFVKAFSKLFRSAFFSKEYLYTFIYAIGRAPQIDYHAYNRELFGTIARSQIVGRSLGQELEDAQRVFEFDRIGSRDFYIDRTSVIESFQVKEIDDDTVAFVIKLPKKNKVPKYLFFRLDYKKGLRYKNLLQGVVLNRGTLKPGINQIVVHRGDTAGVLGKIAKYMFSQNYKRRNIVYALSIGQDGNRWGAIAETRLELAK